MLIILKPFAWMTCTAILVGTKWSSTWLNLWFLLSSLSCEPRAGEACQNPDATATYYGRTGMLSIPRTNGSRLPVKAYFSAEPIWALTIGLIKISILLLYVKIFRPLRYMRHSAYGIGVFTICWSIMAILVFCLQCRPVQRIWDKAVPGTCINAWLFFVISSAINVVTDFVVLVLPIQATWGLQLPIPQRISVMSIFMLGSLWVLLPRLQKGGKTLTAGVGRQLLAWSGC